ncbi:unnamed protein product [Effrenium voratum]|nr:unnamed protein product [Effrenium voratum]
MGGAPGVEELRAAVGTVKHGKATPLDLGVPAEEVDFEKDLAKKAGLDGLLFFLHVANLPLNEAAEHLGRAKLSELEHKVLAALSPEELTQSLEGVRAAPPTLSCLSSWQRARENCRREVQAIVDRCRGNEEKFTDESWNPFANEAFVMYVDKEKPGWDCTARKAECWKRAKEIRSKAILFSDGAATDDIQQGRCGDCYVLGALGGAVSNRRRFLRQAFVAYDEEVGVYGVLFCRDCHFTYEIVDDVLAVNKYGSFHYARSNTSRDEIWVSILEKAFFKHYTCVEMCDGGRGPEALYSFLGGIHGRYEIMGGDFKEPSKFFEKIQGSHQSGELLSTSFQKPSKGKYAVGGGEEGQCGEKGLPYGLHAGHCYSVLRTAEVDGHHLLCIRNPWARGEWKGPWSDQSEEWTDERRALVGAKKKEDGTFWMAVEDFVQVASSIKFSRTFGPAWQCAAQYGRFDQTRPIVRAKREYQNADDQEISLSKGDKVEILQNHGYWTEVKNLCTGKVGYVRSKDLETPTAKVDKYVLEATDMAENVPLILSMQRENQKLAREWNHPKGRSVTYKDTKYSSAYVIIYDKDGKQTAKLRFRDRHVFQYLEPAKGPFEVYVNSPDGRGKRFALYSFAPHGVLSLEKKECSYSEFLDKIG